MIITEVVIRTKQTGLKPYLKVYFDTFQTMEFEDTKAEELIPLIVDKPEEFMDKISEALIE